MYVFFFNFHHKRSEWLLRHYEQWRRSPMVSLMACSVVPTTTMMMSSWRLQKWCFRGDPHNETNFDVDSTNNLRHSSPDHVSFAFSVALPHCAWNPANTQVTYMLKVQHQQRFLAHCLRLIPYTQFLRKG